MFLFVPFKNDPSFDPIAALFEMTAGPVRELFFIPGPKSTTTTTTTPRPTTTVTPINMAGLAVLNDRRNDLGHDRETSEEQNVFDDEDLVYVVTGQTIPNEEVVQDYEGEEEIEYEEEEVANPPNNYSGLDFLFDPTNFEIL